MRSCLSLAASYSAGRKSIYRWPWSSKFGLTYRLKLGRTFLTWCEMFVTLTFFSQLGGYSPACQYQPFFSSSYSNMADGFCFPVYANTDLKGRSNRGLAKITMLSPSGGIREKPWLPTNSCSNEVITACQYPCMAGVQKPSHSEPRAVIALKHYLQNSKAMCCRKGWTKVKDSIRKERNVLI